MSQLAINLTERITGTLEIFKFEISRDIKMPLHIDLEAGPDVRWLASALPG
jgi:hypothetical protein